MVNQISAPPIRPFGTLAGEELVLGFKDKLQKAPALCPGGRGGSLCSGEGTREGSGGEGRGAAKAG